MNFGIDMVEQFLYSSRFDDILGEWQLHPLLPAIHPHPINADPPTNPLQEAHQPRPDLRIPLSRHHQIQLLLKVVIGNLIEFLLEPQVDGLGVHDLSVECVCDLHVAVVVGFVLAYLAVEAEQLLFVVGDREV